MKICQVTKNILYKSIIICIIFTVVFIFFINVIQAQEDWGGEVYGMGQDQGDYGGEIFGMGKQPTTMEILVSDLKEIQGSWKIWWMQHKWDVLQKTLKDAAAVAYKKMLANFLNQFAYDTATYLATGDKGQSPMFDTDQWGNYLKNTADDAAGFFIEDLGRNGAWGTKFNLCEPDINIKLQITVGLQQMHHPYKPACTFSKMVKNWDQALKDPDFLPKFQDLFNPASNDLGQALTLQTGLSNEIDKKINESTLMRLANQGIKDVTAPVSGNIKTPGKAVVKLFDKSIEDATSKEKVYTGNIVADSIDIFFNTLIGKLFNKWFKEGIATSFPEHKSWDYNKDAQNDKYGGLADAKERFKNLIEPSFGTRGDYNILSELTMCSDPTKAGPTNCVIMDNFRQAIETRMTVGQAMKEGYLNPSGIFGFTSDGLEPPYNEGYPYRSMPILRKFRIIPVGWEIAAEYIKNYSDKTYNLGDMVACYDSSDDYAGLDESWCHGLVDPSWVLKAPLNYCKREGAGPEIISDQVMGEGYSSQRVIARNDSYCGDEQSCIKENDDGSCQLYGYCTEERRKWQLNAKSCEPKYNTCQTFQSEAGNTISYLENTLDYGSCNADNAGCKAYCADYDFTNGKWTCTASTGDKIHLDKNAETCDAESEGCSEVIRTKAGVGANLIKNSSFETYAGTVDDVAGDAFDQWGGIGEAVSDGFDAGTAVKMSGNLTKAVEAAPADFVIAGEIFSFSFYAKNCAEGDTYNIEGGETQELSDAADWSPYQTTYAFPKNAGGNSVTININSSSCVVDAIKLERGQPNSYTDYRGAGLEYLKIAPDYLNCDGNSDPAECANFARQCSAGEVGCDLYTSKSDDSSIPAKALAQDYCSAECAGYDAYIQGASAFDSLRNSYFIPKTAKTCGSSAAGCDQFTNLDEVEKGGEGVEYYSSLRQCVRIGDAGADCGEFYTWEGSDETGYQLKVHQLEKAGAEPSVTEDDSAECDKDIYSLSPADPAYNPDCREFYNKTGDVYYHLYARTKTCSDNCHPYRRSENNINPDLADPASCSAAGSGYAGAENSQFHWDGATGECVYCKNSGEWNGEQNGCVYMAIPSEGASCSANNNGCREYRGNAGNNIKIVSISDFEGSKDNWSGVNTTVELSSEALTNGGNSLFIKDGAFSAALRIGEIINKNSPYVLSFIVKSAGAEKITSIKLANSAGNEAVFSLTDVSLYGNWDLYKTNLAELNHLVDEDEILTITGDGAFYIDNIKLTEITDIYYLIKDSWTTPNSCYYDMAGNYVGPYANAGCDEYQDRDNKIHYLHQFSGLCSDSAVGCEVIIDTHNSRDYNAQTFNSGDLSEITAPADSYVYLVYDQAKKCNQEDKACQRLGSPAAYSDTILYSDVYFKNNPDKYNSIMCKADEVYCGQWTSGDGAVYFKDPGNMLCEWRQKAGQAVNSWGWLKIKVKRCDISKDGKIGAGETVFCANDSDCATGVNCLTDDNDYDCFTSSLKTFGAGGAGNAVLQPIFGGDGNWVGLCPASQAGCAEYIEPVSKFMPNLIFNGDFSQNVDGNNIADGWSSGISGRQNVILEPNTLYILAVEGANMATVAVVDGTNLFFELDNNNRLDGPFNFIIAGSGVGERISKRFYTAGLASAFVIAENASAGYNGKIELRKAIADYKIKQDLDESTCNGVVDFEQGCVLFNKRGRNGSNFEIMQWDVDLTINDRGGISPQSGLDREKDANIILKVSPDRICDKWLACRSYIKDENNNNVCFDIGLCNSVDDNGNCNNFVVAKKENQTYSLGDIRKISNLAGYAKAGVNWGGNKIEGYYPAAEMEQVGQTAKVSNGGFEFYGSNGYPVGWNYTGAASWDVNVFSVVNNPFSAQIEGIGYAPEGSSFLKLGSAHSATSEFIDVSPDIDYILTAYINTKNLSGAAALASIEQFRADNNSLGAGDIISLAGGNDWTYKLGSFKTNSAAARIKITLHSQGKAAGNYYFDDIKIKPALNSKSNGGSLWYTSQTCRLYPESDSLSCEYYDDSSMLKKGWSGYCLEYDRYPGSSDACILWWPTDKVKGEGIEEGAGYLGKAPVYYCAEAKNLTLLEYRQRTDVFDCTGNGDDDSNGSCPPGYERIYKSTGDPGCGLYKCEPAGQCYNDCLNEPATSPDLNKFTDGKKYGWYVYNGFHTAPSELGEASCCGSLWSNNVYNEISKGVKFLDTTTGEVFDNIAAYCSKIAMAVNNVGDNKYWSGRVYEGSDYQIIDLNYQYAMGGTLFGSIVPPAPAGNPYEWDSLSAKDGFQPLYVRNDGARASYPYKITNDIGIGNFGICQSSKTICYHIDGISSDLNKADCAAGDVCQIIDFLKDPFEKIKRIFAQSYGSWEWNSAQQHYIPISGGAWTTPASICVAELRPDYPNDYCGILPKINNMRVNNRTGNFTIIANQFVNFTFNTLIDSQQQPLVSYAVDWGDNEFTSVSGAEMRDRPNADNPHSMYHLYSYWDLKAKNATDKSVDGGNIIYCGDAGAETRNYNNAGNGYICPAASACCVIRPSAKIKDNWGWCNNGINGTPCPEGGYQDYGGWIAVREK